MRGVPARWLSTSTAIPRHLGARSDGPAAVLAGAAARYGGDRRAAGHRGSRWCGQPPRRRACVRRTRRGPPPATATSWQLLAAYRGSTRPPSPSIAPSSWWCPLRWRVTCAPLKP